MKITSARLRIIKPQSIIRFVVDILARIGKISVTNRIAYGEKKAKSHT